jgi:hypothetical protein
LDLGGHAHRFATPRFEELVGVAVLGDQHVGDETGQPARQPPVIVIDGVQRQSQHTDLITAVQQRQEDPDGSGQRLFTSRKALPATESSISSGSPTIRCLPGNGTSSIWS